MRKVYINGTDLSCYIADNVNSENICKGNKLLLEGCQNTDKIIKYYKRDSSSIALNNIGSIYKLVDLPKEMVEYYKISALLGNAVALINLGEYYQYVKINYKKMKECYIEAITKFNSSVALNNLGNYYYITKKKYEKMKICYNKAISLGNSCAIYNLGEYYDLIENSHSLMKHYYLICINEHQSGDAALNLGFSYQNMKKYDKMEIYFLKAIELGNSKGAFNLAWYYDGINRDVAKMKKYYKMGIDIDENANSMYNLALYYSSVKKYDKMIKLYEKSITLHDDKDSIFNLAIYYSDVEKNVKGMKYYHKMAVTQFNYLDSMLNLAVYYKDVKKFDKMKNMCKNAIENGSSAAAFYLAVYYNYVGYDKDKMIKYYLIAIAMDNIAAIFNFGYYYETLEKNYEMMEKYYLMGVARNCGKCMIRLGNYYKVNKVICKKYIVMQLIIPRFANVYLYLPFLGGYLL
jgi:TPR repeat protein